MTGERDRRYLQAGVVYGALGALILLLAAASPAMLRPERRADLVHLAVGLPFFVLFALLIARGDRPVAWLARKLGTTAERAARVGRGVQTVLTMILTLSALGRTLVFLANGLGHRPRLQGLSLRFEPTDPDPRMLLSALLMAIIFLFLARASWLPVVDRRSSRPAR